MTCMMTILAVTALIGGRSYEVAGDMLVNHPDYVVYVPRSSTGSPVWSQSRFAAPKLFAPRKTGNSFYTSYTVIDGRGVLWFNDRKYYLLGRKIGAEWFD